jgi:tRNA nucleotidyltransferase/poly(A) polymerase
VGGFVRDLLLGRAVHDVDLVVPSGAIVLARAVADAFGGGFVLLDEDRDVARAVLKRDGVPLTVDVARLRAPDLAGDLALRDFTVNAMASDLNRFAAGSNRAGEIVDLFGGQADLAGRLLRAVGPNAFQDDPLRTLRGVRLSAELNFVLEDATAGLIRRDAQLLVNVSAERVRDELVRIIGAPGAWQHLRLLADLDLLRPTLPEAQALVGVTQSAPHYLDVFDHTRAAMAHAEGILALLWPEGPFVRPILAAGPDIRPAGVEEGEFAEQLARDPVMMASESHWDELAATLRPYQADLQAHMSQLLASGRARRDLFLWAALAHDWGKPVTRSVGVDWRAHFFQHEHESSILAENRMRLLAFSANEAGYVAQMADLHMRPGQLARHHPPTRRALYRFFRDAASVGPDVVLLSLADKMSTRAPHAAEDAEFWPALLDVSAQVLHAYFREEAVRINPQPLLDGRAIMAELDLAPGPRVGELLAELREAQAVGDVQTIAEALAWLHAQQHQEL